MGPSLDFQTHLAALEANGLLVRVDRPINKDTELHPLVRWQFLGGIPEDDRRAFLFTNVVDSRGRRYDIPVAVGALAASAKIYALGMGCPVNEIGAAWTRAIANPIPPVIVNSPRCQEVILTGSDLCRPDGGLARLPIPISTPGFDSAPYLTATLCITPDPEIVIEGLIDTDLLEPEGPFGESNGYVALEDYNMSLQVTAITHRRNPVFVSIISQVTPSESSMIKKVAYEPMFLAHLREHLGIKGIRRVVMHEPLSNVRPVICLQFAGRTPRTGVSRGLQGAASLRADCGKITISVSEDIDTSITDAVLWSLAYRSNPQEDVRIQTNRSIGHAPKAGPQATDSTILIDSTLKYPMPPLALPQREFMQRALEIWKQLDLPALRVQPPWHGYSLGDWNDAWVAFASNAVAAAWGKNGLYTFPRRRGGLTPETPAPKVEGPPKSGT